MVRIQNHFMWSDFMEQQLLIILMFFKNIYISRVCDDEEGLFSSRMVLLNPEREKIMCEGENGEVDDDFGLFLM